YAMSVPVVALTQALLGQLEREPGVRLHLGTTVRLVKRPGGGFTVQASQGERKFVVEPRMVAACDGKHSATRVMAGISSDAFVFESGYVEVPLAMPAEWGTRMRAHISERGYVLATPVAGPELLLVWIAEPRAVTETLHRGTAELAAVLAAQVPSLADAVTAA